MGSSHDFTAHSMYTESRKIKRKRIAHQTASGLTRIKREEGIGSHFAHKLEQEMQLASGGRWQEETHHLQGLRYPLLVQP